MGWWKADPVPEASAPSQQRTLAPSSSPSPSPSQSQDSASACPVDPKTREIWLQSAKAKARSSQASSLPPAYPPIPEQTQPPIPTAFGSSQECSSSRIDQSPNPPSESTPSPANRRLSNERAVSSIPRAQLTTPSAPSTIPANAESETGPHKSGNWIYPSESQFFHAVMRKQTASDPASLASSISHIIPIHNAVNERAWHLIKTWEGNSSDSCGGPKLLSFQGLGAGALSPKARLKSLWGYTEPFDRHDWVVERCGGVKVEYVIDFYQGKKEETKGREGNLNFYLDVRPKLNTLEGWRMRAERLVGFR